MRVLLALILAALIVVIVVLVIRSRQRPTQPPQPEHVDPLADRNDAGDVRTLRTGDMVDYLDTLYFVRGSLRLSEGGFAWSEHFLDDGRGSKVWISVEEDPDLEVVLWTEHDAELSPAEKSVSVDGVEYQRSEHGTGRFRSEGTTGLGEAGKIEYVDYEAPGGKYLSFERFDGGSWEVGLGEQVLITALTVYPAGSRP